MTTSESLAERAAAFRFDQPIAPRLNDFDLFGHVNNAVYLTYLRNGTLRLLEAVTRDAVGRRELILAHISMDYRRPIRWGEPVRVLVRAVAVGSKSFTLEYLSWPAPGPGEFLAAEVRSVQVMYDYTAAAQRAGPPP